MTSMIGNQGMRGAAGNASRATATGGNIIPKGYKQGQLQQYTPEQMNLFQQLFSDVQPGSYLSKLAAGDEGTFEQSEAPAMRQFQQLQGQIGSRFSQLSPGSMSAQRGSGFKNTLNQASSDFAQDLRSQRMGLQRQALQDLLGLSQGLLGQRPTEQFLVPNAPKKKPFWQELLSGLTPGIGEGAGSLGGMFGAAKLGLLA